MAAMSPLAFCSVRRASLAKDHGAPSGVNSDKFKKDRSPEVRSEPHTPRLKRARTALTEPPPQTTPTLGAATTAPAPPATSSSSPVSTQPTSVTNDRPDQRSPPLAALFDRKKPRAFENAIPERGGWGSCWINAALQAMFAPLAFKAAFTRLWYALPLEKRHELQRRVDHSQPRYPNPDEAPGLRLVNIPALPADGPGLEQCLAMAFGCAHNGPHAKPMLPSMITDHFYQLHQEDAAEFLVSRLLNTEVCSHLSCTSSSSTSSIKPHHPTILTLRGLIGAQPDPLMI